MAHLPQLIKTGQPRPALQGVQGPFQVVTEIPAFRVIAPGHQAAVDDFAELLGLFQEDVENLQVHFIGQRRVGLGVGPGRLGRRRFGGGGGQRESARVAQIIVQRGDQVVAAGQRLPGAELVDHLRQPVVATMQQVEQHRLHRQAVQGQGFVEGFQFMAQVAEGLDLGHAGAALKGVQIALQGLNFKAVAGIGDPGVQAAAGGLENIVGFLEEDRHQLGVALGAVAGRRGLWLGFRLLRGTGTGGRIRRLAQHRLAQSLDHRRRGLRLAAAAQRVDHVRQPVVAPVQHVEQRGRGCRLVGAPAIS